MIQPRKIKQGKDIAIAWNVPRKDNINMTIQQATSLSVWFVNRKNRIKIQPSLFDVRDNIIYIQLTGSAQKYTGIYDIECVYQFPSIIMSSGIVNCPRDFQGAFEIVDKETSDDYGDLPASLQLDSSIEYAFRGLSAYELAVQQGFEGTLDEWLESLNGSGVGGGLTQSQKNWIGEGIVLVNEGSSLPEAININTQEIGNKAPKDHTHDYAPVSHNHDSVYAPKAHTHTGFALESHNHDLVYAPKSHTHDYAPATHNHDSVYATKAHTHTDKLDAPTTTGTSGQVLTMTDTGTEWKTPTCTPGTGEGLTEAQKTFLGVSGDLQTESKVSLPSAINEVAGEVQKVWNEVGKYRIGPHTLTAWQFNTAFALSALIESYYSAGMNSTAWDKTISTIDCMNVIALPYLCTTSRLDWSLQNFKNLKYVGTVNVVSNNWLLGSSDTITAIGQILAINDLYYLPANCEDIGYITTNLFTKSQDVSRAKKLKSTAVDIIIASLATVSATQTITFYSAVKSALTQDQINTITGKGWTIA